MLAPAPRRKSVPNVQVQGFSRLLVVVPAVILMVAICAAAALR